MANSLSVDFPQEFGNRFEDKTIKKFEKTEDSWFVVIETVVCNKQQPPFSIYTITYINLGSSMSKMRELGCGTK
jgi:hypothetical protein